MERFEAVSPLDFRYYGAEPDFFNRLKPYVSEEANVRYQARVECALVHALFDVGLAPPTAVKEIVRAFDDLDIAEVYAEEERIHHNIRALVNCLTKRMSPENRRWVHLFATSSDIMDTATALRFKELARDVLLPDLIELQQAVADKAEEQAETLQIGRTHGKYAEPITFGFAMALYVSRLGSRIRAMEAARKDLRGKFSGAVGAYNALALQFPNAPHLFEKLVLAHLDLRPSDTSISTQIVEPEYVTDLAYAAASTFSVLANLADDIRQLHRSEIAEVQEEYEDHRVGSSTMPHKTNPKNFENVKSLWKQFMPRLVTVMMDQISEHQRDLTNSASSRFLTELFTALDYAAVRLTSALGNLQINVGAMRHNAGQAAAETVAEPLYVLLSLAGHPDSYNYVRSLVARARREDSTLAELIWDNPALSDYLEAIERQSPSAMDILRQPTKYTGHAAGRARATVDHWRAVSAELADSLRREREAAPRPNIERIRAVYEELTLTEQCGAKEEDVRACVTERARQIERMAEELSRISTAARTVSDAAGDVASATAVTPRSRPGKPS
jgi:adenylosuccinate lyase